MSSSAAQAQGPPYPPTTAGLGGEPSIIPDVPVLAILLCFYIGGAIGNMALLQINLRRHQHKFIISGALFGFCMARITTCSLRIASAAHPQNISLSIASNIFVNAGILIVYIVDLVFLQRIVRARRPVIGWHKVPRVLYKVVYTLVALALVLLITFIVLSFYTLNAGLKQAARDIQLICITYFLVIAALPLFVLPVVFLLPKSPRAEEFGKKGGMMSKALILTCSSLLCTLNAGFKAGANYPTPRPISDPAWYQKKAAFYVFLFVLEILIVYFFLAVRIDQRFHVPNGSSKVDTYATDPSQDSRKAQARGSDEEDLASMEEVRSGNA